MSAVSGVPGLVGVDHLALTVPDLPAALEFYCDVLGATRLHGLGPFDARELPAADDGRDWTEAHLGVRDGRLRFEVIELGGRTIELFEYERPEPAEGGAPTASDSGGHHLGLRVEDLGQAADYLRDRGVSLREGPIDVPEGAPGGAMRCLYFADPWGHELELVERD